MAGKTTAERRASRGALMAAARSRHAHGRPFSETPRGAVVIRSLSDDVIAPHLIEAARVRPDHSMTPAPDATFTPATEGK